MKLGRWLIRPFQEAWGRLTGDMPPEKSWGEFWAEHPPPRYTLRQALRGAILSTLAFLWCLSALEGETTRLQTAQLVRAQNGSQYYYLYEDDFVWSVRGWTKPVVWPPMRYVIPVLFVGYGCYCLVAYYARRLAPALRPAIDSRSLASTPKRD